MYKTILVHLDAEDAGTADRVRCAVALATDHKARLIGVAAGMPLATVEVLASGGAALAGGVVTGDPDELDERFAAAEAEFKRWTTTASIETAWRTAVNFPGVALSAMAAVADLIVVGGRRVPHYGDGYITADAGDLVMRAGRPVLAVPQGVSELGQADIVVAWKNTREARRALRDAPPLLQNAPSVTLLHIQEDGDGGLADASEFLRQHCIGATVVETKAAGDAGKQIIRFATQAQARVIVAGAYGHTRLREWAFGGVTRTLLRHAP